MPTGGQIESAAFQCINCFYYNIFIFQVVSSFMKSFREYVESPTRFKKSLLPTEVAPEADIRYTCICVSGTVGDI